MTGSVELVARNNNPLTMEYSDRSWQASSGAFAVVTLHSTSFFAILVALAVSVDSRLTLLETIACTNSR